MAVALAEGSYGRGCGYRRKREAVAEAKPESDADPKDFYLFPTLM